MNGFECVCKCHENFLFSCHIFTFSSICLHLIPLFSFRLPWYLFSWACCSDFWCGIPSIRTQSWDSFLRGIVSPSIFLPELFSITGRMKTIMKLMIGTKTRVQTCALADSFILLCIPSGYWFRAIRFFRIPKRWCVSVCSMCIALYWISVDAWSGWIQIFATELGYSVIIKCFWLNSVRLAKWARERERDNGSNNYSRKKRVLLAAVFRCE